MNIDSILYKISKVLGDIPTHVEFDKVSDGSKRYKIYSNDKLLGIFLLEGNQMKIYKGGKYIGREYLNKEELAKL